MLRILGVLVLCGAAELEIETESNFIAVRGLEDSTQAAGCRFNGVVFINSVRGQQLEDMNGQIGMRADRGAWQKWTLSDAGDNKVYIKSHRGQQLEDANGKVGLRADRGQWQKWTLSDAGDNKVFINSHRGQQLEDAHGKVGLRAGRGQWQKWTLTKLDGSNACTKAAPAGAAPVAVAAPVAAAVCSGDVSEKSLRVGNCNSPCAKTVNGHNYKRDWCYTTADRALNTPKWCWCKTKSRATIATTTTTTPDSILASDAAVMANTQVVDDDDASSHIVTKASASLTFKLYCLAAAKSSIRLQVLFPNEASKDLKIERSGVSAAWSVNKDLVEVGNWTWTDNTNEVPVQRGMNIIKVITPLAGIKIKELQLMKGQPACSVSKAGYSWKLIVHQSSSANMMKEDAAAVRQSFKSNEKWDRGDTPYVSIGSLNKDDPGMRFKGRFLFKAAFDDTVIEWMQSNWLIESKAPTGLQCIKPLDCSQGLKFTGLALSGNDDRLLDTDGPGAGTAWTVGSFPEPEAAAKTRTLALKATPTCNGDISGGATVTSGSCNSTCAKTVNGHSYENDWCYTTGDRTVNTNFWCWCTGAVAAAKSGIEISAFADAKIVSLWVASSSWSSIEGSVGEAGILGNAGPAGRKGPAGETGVPGENGNHGMAGMMGENGTVGEKGDVGFSKSSKLPPDMASTGMVAGVVLLNLVCVVCVRTVVQAEAKKEGGRHDAKDQEAED